MTAQHPMSELLRAKAALGDELSMTSGLQDAADALDAMQARYDALQDAANLILLELGGVSDEMAELNCHLRPAWKKLQTALAAERAHREADISPPDPEDTSPCDPIADQRMDAADVGGGS